LGLLACGPERAVVAPPTFPVGHPGREDAAYEREYVGEVHALRRADVRARIEGRIEAVAVDEGQTVEANQVLFTLNDERLQQELRQARAAVASAAAELKAAQTERASTKILLDKNVVSTAEMALIDARIDGLAAELEAARAAEARAAIDLSYAEIRAPFAGVVNRLPRKVGSMVDQGELLTTVTNASEILVYFRVPESEYLEFVAPRGSERADEISFVLVSGERLPATGVVDAVETEIDRGTGTIAFRARFPNQGGLLKHGSSGKVLVKSILNDALTVPQKSTFEVQDQLYVYVVEPDGTARARRIVPRLRLDQTFVVESGLAPDDRFILDGVQKVRDGTQVIVRAANDAPPAL